VINGTILLAVAAMSLVTLDTVKQLAALAEVRRNRRFAEVVWRVHTEGPDVEAERQAVWAEFQAPVDPVKVVQAIQRAHAVAKAPAQ